MRLLLVNTHSALNSGDLAITMAELDVLGSLHPRVITITSRTPAIDRRVLGPWNPRVLPPLSPAPSVFVGRMATISGCGRNLCQIGAKSALMREIRRCDLVIGSGGGYFWSNRRSFPGPMFFQNYLPLHLAQRLGTPVILFPQSFGPAYNGAVRRMLGSLLSGCQVKKVFARERLSFDFIRELLPARIVREKVELCGDAAFCLGFARADSAPPARLEPPAPAIAVTVRQWDFPEAKEPAEKARLQDAYLDSLARACAAVGRQRGGSVLVFPQARGPGRFEDDAAISHRFTERLAAMAPALPVRYLPLPDAATPFDIIQILSQVHLVVATRFHSAILGFLAGVPAVSIAYQPKGRGIMEEMGLDDLTLDISAVDADRLAGLMIQVLDDREAIAARVRERVGAMRTQIREKILSAVRNVVC